MKRSDSIEKLAEALAAAQGEILGAEKDKVNPHPALHPNAIDLTGREFDLLTVEAHAGSRNGKSLWKCRCKCGKTKTVIASNLTRLLTRSCGRCKGFDIKSSEYRIWSSMKSRCQNPNHRAYHHYGQRGITVDPRWEQFENFLSDMGPKPEGMSLDRKDNDLGYSPSNCRWATGVEQHNNTRTNRHLTIEGRTQTMAQWARERGLNYRTVKTRLNVLGWTPEEALAR